MEKEIINKLIKLSKKAAKKNNVPVSAIIVKDNKIVASSYNRKNKSNLPFDHAEIIAIKKACRKLKSWRLNDCYLYVTLKPCNMCYGVIAESRIKLVKYLLDSTYTGVESSNLENIKFEKIENDGEYKNILSDFFKNKR